MLTGLKSFIESLPTDRIYGHVHSVHGLLVEVVGIEAFLRVGNQCRIHRASQELIWAEVVGFKNKRALLMAFDALAGIGPGAKVEKVHEQFTVAPSNYWLGRVVDGFARPLDNQGPLLPGSLNMPVLRPAPLAFNRKLVGPRVDLGVRALNTFTTCCLGQRMGIFAGSGVGKSVLLSQITRFTECDIIIMGLIGERGREVREFIEQGLDNQALQRTIIVVATGDEPALMRRQAAFLTLTLAEYFSQNGHKVLCVIDSITRFAMALREIGLSIGEPPSNKGYTPSVFAELPRLLERAGPDVEGNDGYITGLFTVLVEGDNHNEPISDAVRGILDGHIVLDREIAQRNRFPSINVLHSISRTMPDCNAAEETDLVNKAREMLAAYEDMAEMIRLGAYRKGSNTKVDQAIGLYDRLEQFLAQSKYEQASIENGFAQLADIMKPVMNR